MALNNQNPNKRSYLKQNSAGTISKTGSSKVTTYPKTTNGNSVSQLKKIEKTVSIKKK